MFFRPLGTIIQRRWGLILVGWLLVFVGAWLAAPPWSQVAQDRQFAFLPEKTPSRVAEAIFERAFPDEHLASNVVLVLHGLREGRTIQPGDLKYVEDVIEPRLRAIADAEGGLAGAPRADEPLFADEPGNQAPVRRSIIARIRTPNAPGTGALLISQDRRAMLVVLELTTEFLAAENWPTLDRIQSMTRELSAEGRIPEGLAVATTGSAVIGRDHTVAQLESARATERWTVVLVILLLLAIYRAPLLAIIPLATVFIAVQLSLKVLALLSQTGVVTLFEGIQIYITILSYGAGVDYCLFLIARYREELDHGAKPGDAVARAVSGVGPALAASAATVMVGIGMMYFAEFGKFSQAGIAIPLSLLIVLCANLTLTPALLCLAGRWAFWPHHAVTRQPDPAPVTHRSWDRVGDLLLRRPGIVRAVTVACMTPFVVVAALHYNRLSYDLIGDLPEDSRSVQGTRLLQEHFPAGLMGPATVLLVNPRIDFETAQGRAVVRDLTHHLVQSKGDLGLIDVRSLAEPLGVTEAGRAPVAGVKVSQEAAREAMDRLSLERYVTDLGERKNIGTRLDLVFQSGPFAHESLDRLARIEQTIREALPQSGQNDWQIHLLGATASVRDLAAVMQRDRQRIEILVLASVFLILAVLLRRLGLSLYLLLSVLFSYYTTLGVAFTVFWALDPQGFTGIDWKVAIFLFTILVAVGEDYNIFLVTRIDEESAVHGPERGVTHALTKTGPIISSCGIIMAGTFAALLAGSLIEMKQLGFALAFGIMLDTFVVRPILVPSFLILLHKARLRPLSWLRKSTPIATQTPATDAQPQ